MASDKETNWRAGQSLVGNLQHMKEKQQQCDVLLSTEEDDQPVIKAHKVVLIAQSAYFEDLFDREAVPIGNTICIKDIKHSVLQQVIR